jgi:alkylation response protein AidB-like acyl-CoA dehydrogenase
VNHAPHIAGNPDALTPLQRELIALAATLGRERFAPRAARWDREASFPFDNYADLRAAGLLGICVPKAQGGLGADFATYVMVAAELGRHCGSTALSFNMHVSSTMWAGFIADALDMSAAERADHERIRALHFARIVGEGKVYSQPFSEGGAAAAGKAPWGTRALAVEGGYRVSGKKIFASLSGAADVYGVLCTLERAGAIRCTSRCRPTRRASPSRASGTRWACAARSAARSCSTTSSFRTRRA